MIRQAISCDICDSEKQQTNHWFVAYEQAGELQVSGWNSRNRLRPGSKHLCGQTCLHKLVDEFIANAIAVRPNSFVGDDVEVDDFTQPAQMRTEVRSDARSDARSEARPEARPEVGPETRFQHSPEFSSDFRVASRPEPLTKRRPAPLPEALPNSASATASFEPVSAPPRRRSTPKARTKSAVAKMVESYISDGSLASDQTYAGVASASDPVNASGSSASEPPYSGLDSSSNSRGASACLAAAPVYDEEFGSTARLISPEEAIAIKRAMANSYDKVARPATQSTSMASVEAMPKPVAESLPVPAAARVMPTRFIVEEPAPDTVEVPRFASRNWRAEAWEREREREREQRSLNQHSKVPARRHVN